MAIFIKVLLYCTTVGPTIISNYIRHVTPLALFSNSKNILLILNYSSFEVRRAGYLRYTVFWPIHLHPPDIAYYYFTACCIRRERKNNL